MEQMDERTNERKYGAGVSHRVYLAISRISFLFALLLLAFRYGTPLLCKFAPTKIQIGIADSLHLSFVFHNM
ncbi:hypothetical protein M430DRAFT_171936 [Amorphotheca resinae ATCC 22711]|uniref:Uncharacterized protein n=1 Tax=Amorphotheca resinae ATCC 22711 TaxID=857342 RepID=A0A2T3AV14_AMORE|nr:hypothetical protein M430DRAFT_171936 [Amorphotheca resinae ATCC 22711]PSS12511.1 hypothetical protein M430DRAFT_171936 [Amorphotheca resinae ATCC 22711]